MGFNAGQTRVYRFDAAVDDWVQFGQDIEGEAAEDYSGSTVALNSDGSILAVGAEGNDGADTFDSLRGHVRVFQINDDNTWLQLGSDLDGLEAGDEFGSSVALSADGFVLVVGTPRSDPNGLVDSGEVTVYEYANSTWNQRGNRLSGEVEGDWFGHAVSYFQHVHNPFDASPCVAHKYLIGLQIATSADGKTVAVGAWMSDSNGFDSGHAKVFTFKDENWEQLGNTIIGESSQGQAGYSVSLSAGSYFLKLMLKGFIICYKLIFILALLLFRWPNTGCWSESQ